jgi:hypothetical protein
MDVPYGNIGLALPFNPSTAAAAGVAGLAGHTVDRMPLFVALIY